MTSAAHSPGPVRPGSSLDRLMSQFSEGPAPRRALLAGFSAAAAAMLCGGTLRAGSPASSRARSAVRFGDPIVIPVADHTITVEHVTGTGSGSIEVVVVANASPAEPIHRSTHDGPLTDAMIDGIELVAEVASELRSADVNRFNAMLRGMGLGELSIPRPVQPNLTAAGGGFVILIVLFILLVIVGAGFGQPGAR